jgi:hypothetical protein
MKKYRFSGEQQYALWRVYGKKCFYCQELLTFEEVTIDHVLPESILDNTEKLTTIKTEYGLGDEFLINDYCNWVPAHSHCNRRKGAALYRHAPALIAVLEEIKRKGEQAREEEKRLNKNLKSSEVLNKLGIALRKGVVSKDDVMLVIGRIPHKQERYQPIVISFSLNIDQVLNSDAKILPTNCPDLYDWLEKDLIKLLSSLLSCSFFYPEPSQRLGETLSVRLAFVQLNFDELDKFTSPWWKILEIQYYSDVYGTSEWARLRYKNKVRNIPVIDDSEFIELLHRGGLLMGFRQVTRTDYRAVAISQDYMLYQSDSYYDLDMWREILELAEIEEWEIEQAIEKVDTDFYDPSL